MEKKKFMVVITHSTDDPDRANPAMAFISTMIMEEIDVAVLFMFEGILLAKKGLAETIVGKNMTSPQGAHAHHQHSRDTHVRLRAMHEEVQYAESGLIDGVKIITAPTAVHAMMAREVVNFCCSPVDDR